MAPVPPVVNRGVAFPKAHRRSASANESSCAAVQPTGIKGAAVSRIIQGYQWLLGSGRSSCRARRIINYLDLSGRVSVPVVSRRRYLSHAMMKPQGGRGEPLATDRPRFLGEVTYDGRNRGKNPSSSRVRDEIVEHDGGWAYRVDGVFSETFPTPRHGSRSGGARRERAGRPWGHDGHQS
jgi:hypothetical protein